MIYLRQTGIAERGCLTRYQHLHEYRFFVIFPAVEGEKCNKNSEALKAWLKCLIGCLSVDVSLVRQYFTHGDVTIAGEGRQNIGLKNSFESFKPRSRVILGICNIFAIRFGCFCLLG